MSSLDLGLKVMAEISTSPNCICGLMVWRMSETTACQWKSSMIKLGNRLLFSRADGFSDKHYVTQNWQRKWLVKWNMIGKITHNKALKWTNNCWLGFAALHIVANNYLLFCVALCTLSK